MRLFSATENCKWVESRQSSLLDRSAITEISTEVLYTSTFLSSCVWLLRCIFEISEIIEHCRFIHLNFSVLSSGCNLFATVRAGVMHILKPTTKTRKACGTDTKETQYSTAYPSINVSRDTNGFFVFVKLTLPYSCPLSEPVFRP